MNDPVLLIDTWESGGEIDENVLLANGVSGMIVRLNDISGGHHMDDNFIVQWAQAKVLPVRIVYFVYNPWRNGTENYNWLVSHIPDECRAVMVDVEVVYNGYSPANYAAEFRNFYMLAKRKWNCMIYTGEWFLEYLSSWPLDTEYWWASYPLVFYNYESITWDMLRTRLTGYNKPSNLNKVPGILGMWQFTGDRIILPGCSKRMDVNIWYGTLDELKAFANEKPTSDLPVDDVLLSSHTYYDGATEKMYEMQTAHGKTIYNLTVIETAKVKKFFVTPNPIDRDWIPQFMERFGLHFAINLDGWTSPPLVTTGYNASEGKPYGSVNTTENIWISRENHFSITRPANLWNAASVQNWLIKNGVIPYIDKSLTDIRARTAIGWNEDQSLVYFLTVDGGDHWSNEGLNFHDTAALLLKLGCYQAVMFDGGASTAKAVNDNGIIKVIGITCGADSKASLPNYPYDKPLERLPNVLGVIMQSGEVVPPPIGENFMYEVTKSIGERPSASMYNTSGVLVFAGYKFDSLTTVTNYNLLKPSDWGVTFVQLPSGGWLPMVYKGVTYVKTVTPPVDFIWPDKLIAYHGTETREYT